MKYLLNIQKAIIHNVDNLCPPARRMSESNKKYFENLDEAINYYEGGRRKGQLCTRCFPEGKHKGIK